MLQNKVIKHGAVLCLVWLVVFVFNPLAGGQLFLTSIVQAQDDEAVDELDKEAEELEKAKEEAEKKQKKLKKLDKKKKEKEKVKAKYVNQAQSIKHSLNKIVGNIKSLEEDVRRTEQELDKLEEDIAKKKEEIEKRKEELATILQEIDKQRTELTILVLDGRRGLEDYIRNKDLLIDLQKKMLQKLDILREERRELENKKKERDEAKEVLLDQKKVLEQEKTKKSWLYSGTKQKIAEKEAEIKKLEREMAKLQADISHLLGKSYNTNDIRRAARFASRATGVREAFILGMLTMESNLGRYIGGCTYKTSRMNDYRKKLFKQIAKETGHDYKKMPVSCPPANYKGTGGAMGVAQFMSDTWMGYKDRIAAKTGHHPPDPWNLVDGVMAMALKLANDGATKKSGECRAAKRYLGGNHDWYCQRVLQYAKQYEK